MKDSTPTSVYRYYDSNGILLYVGITDRGTKRNREHNDTKEWWQYVTSQSIEHHPTRVAALARERELIKAHQPPFNKVHNPHWRDLQTAYLRLQATSKALHESFEQTPTPANRLPLTIAPAPLGAVTLTIPVMKVPGNLDISSPDSVTVASGGRHSKLTNITYEHGNFQFHIATRDGFSCMGGFMKLKHGQRQGLPMKVKLIELIFEGGK